MRPRTWVTAAVSVALLATACTATAGSSQTTGPPAIHGFSATRSSGQSPLTVAFTWSIPTPESSFTCSLDLDDDGAFEVVVENCTSNSARSATFTTAGSHPVRLRVTDGSTTVTSAPVTLSVAPASTDIFEPTVRYGAGVSPAEIADFEWAADRLTDVVRTGLADTTLDIVQDRCVEGTAAYSGPVDDVLIDAEVGAIDGPGGTLAQAGPCEQRPGGGLTSYGAIKFDSADIDGLTSTGRLGDVILHEMVHVLGFGLFWNDWLLLGAGTPDPRYIGAVARGAWNEIAGPAAVVVPVEADGGPGTADSHWRESELDHELMTGYIYGTPNPLSEVTVGALADLGYGVDMAGADDYSVPPSPTPGLRGPGGGPLHINTELLTPAAG